MKGGVDLTECDANFAPIFLFFIRMTSFLDIVGGMGPSLCIPSFIKIRQLLPPKILLLPPFCLLFYFNLSPQTSKWSEVLIHFL